VKCDGTDSELWKGWMEIEEPEPEKKGKKTRVDPSSVVTLNSGLDCQDEICIMRRLS